MSRFCTPTVLNHPAFIPACVVLGLVARLALCTFLPIEQYSDFAWYSKRALELAAGMPYQESGMPTAYWPVGWPFILSLFIRVLGSLDLAILVANLLSYLLIMGLIYLFGVRVIGDNIAARIALFLYAVYPNHIVYSGLAATEPVYTALLMAAFGLLIVRRNSLLMVAVVGLLFGLTTLVKPQTLLFPVGALIALIWVYCDFTLKRAFAALLVLYVALALVLAPWSYRNYRVFDAFVPVSTNGGVGLFQGASDFTTGGHFEQQHNGIHEDLGIDFGERVASQVEMDRKYKKAARDWIIQNTGEWLAWMPKKIILLWEKDTDGFWALKHTYPQYTQVFTFAQWSNQLFYVFILLCSLPAVWFALRDLLAPYGKLAPIGLLFCPAVFVSLLAAVFTGQIRYHFPAMPLLFLAAAWTLANIRLWFPFMQAEDSYSHGDL